MGFKNIGKANGKSVFLTEHAVDRLSEKDRYMSANEILELLEKRPINYPIDATGAQKIRGAVSGKECFVVISESEKDIIVITGGKK